MDNEKPDLKNNIENFFKEDASAQGESKRLLARQLTDLLTQIPPKELEESFFHAQRLISCYRCALLEVETKFRVLNEQFSLRHERNPIENIKTRIKSPNSIREKMLRKDIPLSLTDMEESINDIAGIRVICSFLEDIYMLADCLIQQDDVTLLERKDYIQHPKENGYRSLHLIVQIPIFLQNEKKKMKVEVQLRTIAMEFWANLEHRLRYKKHLDEEIAAQTAEELSQCAEISAMLDEKMQNIRNIIEK